MKLAGFENRWMTTKAIPKYSGHRIQRWGRAIGFRAEFLLQKSSAANPTMKVSSARDGRLGMSPKLWQECKR